MSGPFNRSGVNTGGTGQVFSDDTYSDINTGGSGQLFPSEQYSTEERVAGEIYTLQINEGILELVDSQGNIAGTYTLPTVTDDRTGAAATGPFAFDGVVIGDNGGLEFSIHNSHGQHGNFAAHLQERIGTGVVVTTVLDDENNVISTNPGEEPITAAAVAAMGRELVSDNRVADTYPAENDEFLLTAGGIVEAIGALSGEGDHITTTGTGDFVTGVTVNEAGNVTALSLNDGDTVLRNIGAQQTIDGVFFASTPAQRAMDPPRGELAFYANVGGTPTREHTQPLEVIGMRGSGTATYTFDDGASLWFEVEIVGAGEGGGGGGTPVFATSDAWEAQDGLTLQLDEYVSTDEDYVPVRADAELIAAGYEAGDSFFITERDIEYQVIITGGNFALQYVISNRDTIAELSGGQGVLDDISDNTTNIATNAADIESVIQHNHEQDARIAALENQDFTTTISSFTESTTLSNLFTSGTIINKGNAGSNLYQAWTVTREGHELIGYLQLTDTERDSFRNEFSLIQGSSSNIYIPANPDSPHTIGIKAFPAADFNDLSSSTQVMLGQISSMRFGGNVGSETMFEIRWELLNYSDAIDTGLGTVDSGEIYGAAGDKRYAFLAPTIYTAPVWEFREATVSRTEIINTGTAVSVNGSVVNSPNFLDNGDADGIHIEVTNNNEIRFNLNHLPGAAYNQNFTYRPGDEVTFNSTIYLSTTNISGNHPPIDGGSSNNVFHGVGAIPEGMTGTGAGQFAWRIAKAGIVIGNYDPDTELETDEVTAESLHFNTDHFVLTPNLTTGDEIIALNPDVIGGGGGSTVRVDGVEVEDPNFVDNAISTTTARGVAFGADAQGNIIGQVDVTGLSGMGESALSGNTAGGLVKVNAAQDGFDDAVAGTDYQAPLTAGTDYQTPLTAGTDYQVPLTGEIIDTLSAQVPDDAWEIAQVNGLNEALDGKEKVFTRSITAPSSPATNDVWYDLNTGTTYVWSGVAWVGDTVRPASQESISVISTLTGANNLGNGFSIESAAGIVTPPTPELARTSSVRDDSGTISDNTAEWSIRQGPSFSGTDGLSVSIGTLSNLVGNYLWVGNTDITNLAFASTLTYVTINTADGDITLMLTDPITAFNDYGWNIAAVVSDLTTSTNSAWENVNWDFYTADPATSGTTGPSTLSVSSGDTDVLDVTAAGVNVTGAFTVNGAAISGGGGADPRIPSSVTDDNYPRFSGTTGTLEQRTPSEVFNDITTSAQRTTINTDLSGYVPATWNAKQDALTAGTDYLAPPGNASASNTGLLTSVDWTTFNGKQAAITTSTNLSINNLTLDGTLASVGGITWRQDSTYWVGSVSGTDVVSIANDGHVRTTANYSVVANAAALTP